MSTSMDFQDLPTFRPKKQKLLAAILVILEEAAERGLTLTKGEIVKAIFLADDQHLARFSRPITFDNYVAMRQGPVGDLTSDMLNEHHNVSWPEFGLSQAPWTRESRGSHTCYRLNGITADRRKLSPSDISALRSALDEVTAKGFGQVSEETHVHPAWVAAWSNKDENARAAAMDWRHFPELDGARVTDLAISSLNAA